MTSKQITERNQSKCVVDIRYMRLWESPWPYPCGINIMRRERNDYMAQEMEKRKKTKQAGTMAVLVVEPMKAAYVKEIPKGLKFLQKEVGGDIEATFPFEDLVGIVLNADGKYQGLPLNRGLYDSQGELYDIIAGTFLVVGLGEEDFVSLTPEQIDKFMENTGCRKHLSILVGRSLRSQLCSQKLKSRKRNLPPKGSLRDRIKKGEESMEMSDEKHYRNQYERKAHQEVDTIFLSLLPKEGLSVRKG